jgi:hypothetical protein
MGIENHLIDIERKLWTNDAVCYRDSLVEEALLLFPETGVINRDAAVDAILNENAEGKKWAEVEFREIQSLRLTDDVALLIYKAVARWQHEPSKNSALASSIYVRRAGVWKLAFHQQTAIQGAVT